MNESIAERTRVPLLCYYCSGLAAGEPGGRGGEGDGLVLGKGLQSVVAWGSDTTLDGQAEIKGVKKKGVKELERARKGDGDGDATWWDRAWWWCGWGTGEEVREDAWEYLEEAGLRAEDTVTDKGKLISISFQQIYN